MHVVSLTPAGTLEVSAASGCVVRDGRVYVIADDDGGLDVERLELLLERGQEFGAVDGRDSGVTEERSTSVPSDVKETTCIPHRTTPPMGESNSGPRRQAR